MKTGELKSIFDCEFLIDCNITKYIYNLKSMNKYRSILLTVFCLIVVVSHAQEQKKQPEESQSQQQTEKDYYEISKQLDIFNALFKEVEMFYVDKIDAPKTIRNAIDYMLSKLDPYTVYFQEEDIDDLKFMTTGEYAGIGSIITQRDGKIYITEPYEGMPAALAGLEAGDEILEIDGEALSGKNTEYTSEKLKGQPNTVVKIKYQRPGQSQPETVQITRKRIAVNPVRYSGVLKDGIGYINLSGFTEHSAAELKSAFENLKKNNRITSLVIDLRDNPGGLMDDAIQMVNLFVPKGEVVLTTKGKNKQLDRTYRTTQEPIDKDMPIAILVNRGSASSSEIVAGAMQDLDRAVIVGTRTFGKGLVQTPRELPFGGGLKVTTSKYYIPSGRCIQAIDYTHRNPDGSVATVPDSLTSVFHTSKGREVKDGGGIIPDFIVEEKKFPSMIYYMLSEFILFDYATDYKQKHKTIAPVDQFTLTDEDYENFKSFVKSKNFDYDRQSEKAMQVLKETMDFEGYMSSASTEFAALEEKLKPNLERDLDLYKKVLSELLAEEIVKRYYFQKGEIIQTLKNDEELDKAMEVLSNTSLYNETLKITQ